MRKIEFARENGWPWLVTHLCRTALYRFRDGFTARKLAAPGFRVGAHPRLTGLAHMKVGRNFRAGNGLWLEAVLEYAGERFAPLLTIGDNFLGSDNIHVGCANRVTIGDGVLLGSGVLISDHAHGSYAGPEQTGPEAGCIGRRLTSAGPIVIGSRVWMGNNVAVLAGATIGDGAVIGANSVVTGHIPGGTIAVGAPARPVRRWDEASRQWLRVESAE